MANTTPIIEIRNDGNILAIGEGAVSNTSTKEYYGIELGQNNDFYFNEDDGPTEDDSILFEARNDGQLISLRQVPSTDSTMAGLEFSKNSDLLMNLNREEEVDLELYNLLIDLGMLNDVWVEVE